MESLKILLVVCSFSLFVLSRCSSFFFLFLRSGREIEPLPHQAPYTSTGMCFHSTFAFTTIQKGYCHDAIETSSIQNERLCMLAEISAAMEHTTPSSAAGNGLRPSSATGNGLLASDELKSWVANESEISLPSGCVRVNEKWQDFEENAEDIDANKANDKNKGKMVNKRQYDYVEWQNFKESNVLIVVEGLVCSGNADAGSLWMVICGFVFCCLCTCCTTYLYAKDDGPFEEYDGELSQVGFMFSVCGVFCASVMLIMALFALMNFYCIDPLGANIGAGFWVMAILGFLCCFCCCFAALMKTTEKTPYFDEDNKCMYVGCFFLCAIGFLVMGSVSLADNFYNNAITIGNECSETNNCLCVTASPCESREGLVSNNHACMCVNPSEPGGQYCTRETGFYCDGFQKKCSSGPACEATCNNESTSCLPNSEGGCLIELVVV
jgi:hypothetical protein